MPDSGFSRRRFLGSVGSAGVAGLGVGLGAGTLGERASASSTSTEALEQRRAAPARAPMRTGSGAQPGVADPPAAFTTVLTYDVAAVGGPTEDARRTTWTLLQRWAALSDRTSRAGQLTGGPELDLAAAGLRIAIGFGAALLVGAGLADRRPSALVDLPAFRHDALRPGWSGGHLGVVVAAEDPMVVAAATQELTRLAAPLATPRWSVNGFLRTSAAADEPRNTPRNLMGHRDGTANPAPTSSLFDAVVSDRSPTTPAWQQGGSYLVVRRIRILLDDWYARPVAAREAVIGRRIASGAPLSGGGEFDPLDLGRTGTTGAPVIPLDAHVRLANAQSAAGARIVRRAYNYDHGWSGGQRDAGQLFLAWQSDPRRGFIPIQQSLDEGADALSRFLRHEGSGVFAFPPAAAGGRPVAAELFA